MSLASRHPEKGQKTPIRQSNFELMRIVAMILILMGHFGAHSGFSFPRGEFSVNKLWIEFFEIDGNISVNVFALLAGYFGIESHSSKTSKLIQLWLQLIFYSMGIYLLFVFTGRAPLALGEILRRMLPISFLQWWFASTFFVLTLFAPFLNSMLKGLTQKHYRDFLALACFCWSVMPTLTGQEFESNMLLWFVFLYALGGYIRLYGVKTRLPAGKLITLSALCVLLTFLSVVLLGVLGAQSEYLDRKRFYFYEIQRIPSLVISLLLFLGFSRLPMKPHRAVNTIASAMFGVYLIHDHPYIRNFFWLDLFHNMDHAEDPLLILRFLGEIIAILVGCTIIELTRIHLLEKRYIPAVHRIAQIIDQKIEALFSTK